MRRTQLYVLACVALLTACGDAVEPTAPHETAEAQLGPPQLAAPTEATAEAISTSEIRIRWRDNTNNETGFEIYRWYDNVMRTTAAGVVTYSDQGLPDATGYCYAVRAFRRTGNRVTYSPYSNQACATTPIAAPTGLSVATISQTRLDLAWSDNSATNDGYEVHRSTTGIGGAYSLIQTVSGTATSYPAVGLESGSQYCFRVRATAYRGTLIHSAFSNDACGTTAGSPPAVPAAPSGAEARPSGSSYVSLGWVDNSTEETGFRVYQAGQSGQWTAVLEVGSNVSATGIGAAAEQPICLRVTSFNITGESQPSNETCTAPPAAPTGFTVVALAADAVELRWIDNSAVEDGYRVMLERYVPWVDEYGTCYWDYYSPAYFSVVDLPPNATSYLVGPAPLTVFCDGQPNTGFDYYYVQATKDGGASDATIAWWPQ